MPPKRKAGATKAEDKPAGKIAKSKSKKARSEEPEDLIEEGEVEAEKVVENVSEKTAEVKEPKSKKKGKTEKKEENGDAADDEFGETVEAPEKKAAKGKKKVKSEEKEENDKEAEDEIAENGKSAPKKEVKAPKSSKKTKVEEKGDEEHEVEKAAANGNSGRSKRVTKKPNYVETKDEAPRKRARGAPKAKKPKKEESEDEDEEDPEPKKLPKATGRGKKPKKEEEEIEESPDEGDEVETKKTKRGAKGKAASSKPAEPAAEEIEESPDEGDEVETKKTKRGAKGKAASSKPAEPAAPMNQTETDWEKVDFSCTKTNVKGEEPNLKIVSWNVDGLRAWLKKDGGNIFKYAKPDILCLQEVKCSEDKIPEELSEAMEGYEKYWIGSDKDGYAGVALFSKTMPLDVSYGIKDENLDDEGRCITAEYENFYLVGTYVPNAGKKLVTLPKRLEWNDAFKKYIKELDEKKPVIICGDMNVAHSEIDLANPKTNTKNAGFTQEERDGMTDFLDSGFVDTYRKLYPDNEKVYTFWTYMMKARSKNVGWRLDYFLVSERIADNVCDNVVHSEVYGSDHCPLTLFINI